MIKDEDEPDELELEAQPTFSKRTAINSIQRIVRDALMNGAKSVNASLRIEIMRGKWEPAETISISATIMKDQQI